MCHLQMPALVLLVADGNQNPRRFAPLHDGNDLVGLSLPEIWIEGFVTPIFG